MTAPRAIIALVASCLVMASGLIERAHEAHVAHVIDAHGALAHASRTDCHGGSRTHLHSLPPQDVDAGACSLLAMHHTVAASRGHVFATPAPLARLVVPAVVTSLAAPRVLIVAPKTSPPHTA